MPVHVQHICTDTQVCSVCIGIESTLLVTGVSRMDMHLCAHVLGNITHVPVQKYIHVYMCTLQTQKCSEHAWIQQSFYRMATCTVCLHAQLTEYTYNTQPHPAYCTAAICMYMYMYMVYLQLVWMQCTAEDHTQCTCMCACDHGGSDNLHGLGWTCFYD